jgi:flagellar protein FliO/FliZ
MTAASESQVLAQLLGSTLFVLVLIVALAWLARRMRWQPRSTDGRFEVLAELPVGGRERILLLRVGDRQALVGVGPGSIASLQLLESPIAPQSVAAPQAPSFLQQWLRARAGSRP